MANTSGIDHLIAGAVSGVASKVVTNPLNVISLNAVVGRQCEGTGILSITRRLLKDGGVRSFWRGTALNVAASGPWQACNFFLFHFYKESLQNRTNNMGSLSWSERILAGGMAGATSQAMLHPFDVVCTRSRMLVASGKEIAQGIYRQGGIRGFYAGVIPAAAAILPASAASFGCYDTLKQVILDGQNAGRPKAERTSSIGLPHAFLCGITSGCAGMTCGYPLTVIQQRMAVQSMLKDLPWRYQYTGVLNAAARILKHEGTSGLFRGWSTSLIRVFPATGIGFTVFELVQPKIARQNGS